MKLIRISAVWCMSCLVTYPDFEALKEKYPDISFIEYDFDQDDVSNYQIGSILPVHILYDGATEVGRIVGEYKRKELEQLILKAKGEN